MYGHDMNFRQTAKSGTFGEYHRNIRRILKKTQKKFVIKHIVCIFVGVHTKAGSKNKAEELCGEMGLCRLENVFIIVFNYFGDVLGPVRIYV